MKRNYKKLPVFIKAMEIMDITRTIIDIMDKEKDELHVRDGLMQNAMIIPAKIAGAEGGDAYSIRFDNATLIKLAAREMMAQTNLLEGTCEEKYIKLLRSEIEKFRIVFLDWVRGFDKNNDIEDEWDIKKL
jgi:hypothetical protein